MTRPVYRLPAVLFLTLLTLALATCISAQEHDFIKYDAAKDEFQMLMVLQDIRVNDADDLDYLAAIHLNRDHLIAPVLPGGAGVFPLAAVSLLRLSNSQFSSVNIFSSRPSSLDPVDTTVPLNTVKITPGTFFLEGKTLGYYQATTVPGAAIDTALEQLSAAAQTEDIAKSVQDELDRRAAGGKVYTWAQLQAETLKLIAMNNASATGAPTATAPAAASQPDEPSINPGMVLDAQSLKNLQQALKDKTLRIRRQKQSLILSLPLSAQDSAGAAELIKQAAQRIGELIQANANKADLAEKIREFQSMQALGRILSVTNDTQGLSFSLDLLRFAETISALPSNRVDMNQSANDNAAPQPENKPAAPDPVQFIRDRKIPLNETLTAAQIISDFNAGMLKSYPSEKPVKPGEGIVKPQ